MADFLAYSPEDVIDANLRETAERMNVTLEQEMAHLRELAAEIVTENGLTPDFLAALPDHRPPRFDSRASLLPQNADMAERFGAAYGVWKSVLLCSELHTLLSAQKALSPDDFFMEAEELSDTAQGRIIYQRNSYADSAYLQFAPILSHPRAVYTHSFETVCEEVYNGSCEYCILPLENTTEGPLTSFTRLIDRYALKIAATCDVPTTDGTRITRFALLRRGLTPTIRIKSSLRYFECALPLDMSPSAADLLCAAQHCGLKLCRLDLRSHQTENGLRPTTHFVFEAEDEHLMVFLLYLAMEAPHFDPVGLYSQLSDQTKS
jgi:prephenate dehydratase